MLGGLLKKFNFFGKKEGTPQEYQGGDVDRFYTHRVKNEQLRERIEAISKSHHNAFATEKFQTPHGTAALKAVYDKNSGIWNLYQVLEIDAGMIDQTFYGTTPVFFNALHECSVYGAGRTPASAERKGIDGLQHWTVVAKAAGQIVDRNGIVQPTDAKGKILLTEYTVSYDREQEKILHEGSTSHSIDDLSDFFKSAITKKLVVPYIPPSQPKKERHQERNNYVAAIFERLKIEKQYGYESPEAKKAQEEVRLAEAKEQYGEDSPEVKLVRAESQYGSDSSQARVIRKICEIEKRKREEKRLKAEEEKKKVEEESWRRQQEEWNLTWRLRYIELQCGVNSPEAALARVELRYGVNSPEALLARVEFRYGKNSPEVGLTKVELEYGFDSPQANALRKQMKKTEEEKKIRQEEQRPFDNVKKILADSLNNADSDTAAILARAKIVQKYGKRSAEFEIYNRMLGKTENQAQESTPKKRFGLF